MKKFIILVESDEQLLFFRRLSRWMHDHDAVMVVVTDKVSVYLKAKWRDRCCAHLVARRESGMDSIGLSDTAEMISRAMTVTEAQVLYDSFRTAVVSLIQTPSDCIFFVWSGKTIGSNALRDLAKELSVTILYFDRGNYSHTLFVDPWGTNRESFIYHHLHLLDPGGDYHAMEISNRLDHQNVGNRTIVNRSVNALFLVDMLYSLIARLPFRGERNPLKKIALLYRKSSSMMIKNIDLSGRPYYFIPMSHSYEFKKDKVGMESLLKILSECARLALENNCSLVISFHPDEHDQYFVNEIVQFTEQHSITIARNSGSDLVREAQKVFLFGTSLAIDVFLQRKEHQFVGQSFYEHFTYERTLNYISHYLITMNIDREGYFTDDTMDQILHRSAL